MEACGKSPHHAKRCFQEVEAKDRSRNANNDRQAERKGVEECIAVVENSRLQEATCTP